MVVGKTLKRAIITLAAGMGAISLVPAAHATGYTECQPYNYALQYCVRYERSWNEETGFGEYVMAYDWFEPYPTSVDHIDP